MFLTRKLYIFTCIHSLLFLKTGVSGSFMLRNDNSAKERLPMKRIYSKNDDNQRFNNIITKSVDNDYGSIFDVLEYGPRNLKSKGKLNRRLVKRIIPHGYRTAKYEYDKKFNTLYKPLFRISKIKPVNKESNRIFIINNNKHGNSIDNKKSMLKEMSNINEYVKTALLQPFTINTYENKKEYKFHTNKEYNNLLLQNAQNYKTIDETEINQIQNESPKRKPKQKINELIRQLGKIIKNIDYKSKLQLYSKILTLIRKRIFMARSTAMAEERNNEDPQDVQKEASVQDLKLKPLQENPFWKYWTYSQTITEDDCEGDLVKFNNICIDPHYK